MKRIHLLLCAALLSVSLLAVEYQAPITAWEGTSGALYGYDNYLVPQSTYDWTQVVENTRITIVFKEPLTANNFLYLYACASPTDYANSNFVEFSDVPSYDLHVGDENFQIVLTGDGVAAFELVPSLFALVYSSGELVMTKVLVEYPVGTSTGLQPSQDDAAVYACGQTIVAPETAQIYSITGQNVTHANGSLAKGVYVVKCGKRTVKVALK